MACSDIADAHMLGRIARGGEARRTSGAAPMVAVSPVRGRSIRAPAWIA
jgi:hypothetical protein